MTDKMDYDRLAYRPGEAAEAIGISLPTIYRWMAQEGFSATKIGGCTIIPRAELQKWLSAQLRMNND